MERNFRSGVAEFYNQLDQHSTDLELLNYGFSHDGRWAPLHELQQSLCRLVFQTARIEPEHDLVDVGFGTGAQDLLLAREVPFRSLVGFNISEHQVASARQRAAAAGFSDRLDFRHGAAEELPGIAPASVDRLIAIECAFHFDRARFYEAAARVLKPGGLVVLTDMALSESARGLTRMGELGARFGTLRDNRALWEAHFDTAMVRPLNRGTLPGAWQLVQYSYARMWTPNPAQWWRAAGVVPGAQLMAFALGAELLRYDLVVLQRPE